jgi:hypothetical protein
MKVKTNLRAGSGGSNAGGGSVVKAAKVKSSLSAPIVMLSYNLIYGSTRCVGI